MSRYSRRKLLLGATALAATTAACGNGIGSRGAEKIDARCDATLEYMFSRYPGTRDLAEKAVAMLIIPLVTKAGLGIGGAYGRGCLRINGVTVDYYSVTSGSFGLQIGAQQYAQVLFFMTDEALREFRSSSGWAVGGDVEYVAIDKGGNVGVETTTVLAPVIAVVFGQAGLAAGATLEGTKYTRIIP